MVSYEMKEDSEGVRGVTKLSCSSRGISSVTVHLLTDTTSDEQVEEVTITIDESRFPFRHFFQ
jgi:hypothetical protein